MENNNKEVDFQTYCKKCIREKESDETDTLCDVCLRTPVREGTVVPMKYEPK